MNNNAKRITRAVAEAMHELILIALDDPPAKKEIIKGGGSNGGALTKELMIRQIENIRISENAFKLCREKKVNIMDYFLLGRDSSKLKNKYGNFFSSNKKTVEGRHSVGHYLVFDHNIPNVQFIKKVYEIVENNLDRDKEYSVSRIITELNKQSIDIITVEEDNDLNEAGFKSSGTKEERDAVCSPKINLKDIWLTPIHVIDQFFETSELDRSKCLDPCAYDGRWLNGEGVSQDILPWGDGVIEKDFLTMKEMPEGISYIVGNIPFSLTKEFVEKAFDLVGEAYFLVNGDTVMNHFNGHIKKLWIINGIEGNQKDFRSRCEFDTIILKKSALWCCIAQITKEKQDKFVIEKDITNQEKRDGFHVALGRNTYLKSEVPVIENDRIIRLQTRGTIKY